MNAQMPMNHRNHYHNIGGALSETIRLMAEIDSMSETHDGWPLKSSMSECILGRILSPYRRNS